MPTIDATALREIEEKIMAGERLSKADGVALYEMNDVISLGALARYVKEQKTGNNAYFNVNRHINLTNICVNSCKFCAFSADEGEPHAYTMTLEEVLGRALEARNI